MSWDMVIFLSFILLILFLLVKFGFAVYSLVKGVPFQELMLDPVNKFIAIIIIAVIVFWIASLIYGDGSTKSRPENNITVLESLMQQEGQESSAKISNEKEQNVTEEKFEDEDFEKNDRQLTKLARSIDLDGFKRAIQSGSQKIYFKLPAGGYRGGFSEVLRKYQLVVIPDHSFAECNSDSKSYGNKKFGWGCRISLKLAKTYSGGIQDTGIRVEWARGFEDKFFVPNNSIWASHITEGNGLLEANISMR